MSSGNGTRPRRHEARRAARHERPALITGGAGFIGTNLARRLLDEGRRVLVFDNLSRPGAERNLRWLRDHYGSRLRVEVGDVRDRMALRRAVQEAGQVYHLAAQVAVTTSMLDPLHDFDVNARGTLNVLAAVHALDDPPPLLFTSTNKVYGALEDVALLRAAERYQPVDPAIREHGIGESRPLAFHSPYGCSKGAADQYVLDYGRTFGVPAAVFRMSCVYGPHQLGSEDQGWVAHFLLRALRGEPVTLFGDGRQVRDVLFVDDLVDAMVLAQQQMPAIAGRAFNIGGGPGRATSLVEVLERIGALAGRAVDVRYDEWRPGDQRYYVSDTRCFEEATGWRPRCDVEEGLARLYQWLRAEGGVAAPPRRDPASPSGAGPASGMTAAAAGASS